MPLFHTSEYFTNGYEQFFELTKDYPGIINYLWEALREQYNEKKTLKLGGLNKILKSVEQDIKNFSDETFIQQLIAKKQAEKDRLLKAISEIEDSMDEITETPNTEMNNAEQKSC